MWKDKKCWGVSWGYSRSRLDPERTNFIVAPAHSLEGGIIITKLTLTAKEVLTLEDSHTALSVVLEEGKKHKSTNNARYPVKSDIPDTERVEMVWKCQRTYSTGDGSEGGQPLNVIGIAASESIALGVLSSLQHKLLALVGGMLITHPAVGEREAEIVG